VETTASALGNGLVALLESAEGARGGLTANAVDELVRIDAPVQFVARFAASDLVLAGSRIGAGTGILAVLGAANHDPTVFPEPDRLVLGRPEAARQVGFGAGAHRCLGAGLARLTVATTFDGLLRRFPHLSLAGAPVRAQRATLRTLARLEVHLADADGH
jgi:hypothetical protein